MAIACLKARAVPANATFPINGQNVGEFLCVTSGTITITNSAGVNLVDAFPVTAGTFYNFKYFIGSGGGTFTAAGGASGTLGT